MATTRTLQATDESAVGTFGTETTGDVRFGRRHVGETQSSLIEILVGEEVSQTNVGCFLRDVYAELLQGHAHRMEDLVRDT